MPDRIGRQELEIVLGKEHISFTVGLLASPPEQRLAGLGKTTKRLASGACSNSPQFLSGETRS